MTLEFQSNAIYELNLCAALDHRSIVIVGKRGTGKSHLAKYFANVVGADMCVSVQPKASEIRETVDSLIQMNTKRVLVVENLDDATFGTSQILLKLFEEPVPNLYIVITCVNPSMVPNTIHSRALRVFVKDPTQSDLDTYAKEKDERKQDVYKKYRAYKTCKTLSDIDELFGYNLDAIKHFETFKNTKFLRKPIGTSIWSINHDDSNAKLSSKIALRVLLASIEPGLVYKEVLDALTDLELGRISENAILTRMVLHLKSIGA